MKIDITISVLLVALAVCGTGTGAAAEKAPSTAHIAQQKLMEGNRRYIEAKSSHPDETMERRREVAIGQHPFASIVSCADSRVAPEIVFDQGLGDIFAVRLAGNIVDDAVLATLEYAVEHLGVKYIMVLGHEKCGAVEAALKGGEAPGHLGSLVKAIQPAIDKVKGQPGDLLDNVVRANVAIVVQELSSSTPILAELVKNGDLTIVGARYDLDDGTVEILI